MSQKQATTHAIERTSPKGPGQPFIGTCRLCGEAGLGMADALKPCPNQRGLSEDDALLEAINPQEEGHMYEITDRYQALGMQSPDHKTMCQGQCDGTGFVPISEDETEEPWSRLWREAETKSPADDGWHFVKCPDCGGTGKAATL